jgi:hypothetical protein
VDEVGVYAEKDATVINSFDDKEQNSLIWNRYVDYKWKTTTPGESDYPIGIGATSGLLRISSVSGYGCPIHVTPAQLISTKNLTKIKVRVYVPANDSFVSGSFLRLNISFNETLSNQNSAQFNLRFELTRGGWNEVELPVNTNATNTFTSNYIYAMSLYKVFDENVNPFDSWKYDEKPWFIDYIQGIYA